MEKFYEQYRPENMHLILKDGEFKYALYSENETGISFRTSFNVPTSILIDTDIDSLQINVRWDEELKKYDVCLCTCVNDYPETILTSTGSQFLEQLETDLGLAASIEDGLKVIIPKITNRIRSFIG